MYKNELPCRLSDKEEMQEMPLWSLGQKDPLEKKMTTQYYNPVIQPSTTQLQYSYLKNSMNTGAWQVTVYGVPRVRHDLATKQ